eukprot:6359617-Amphidinium_carterae.1
MSDHQEISHSVSRGMTSNHKKANVVSSVLLFSLRWDAAMVKVQMRLNYHGLIYGSTTEIIFREEVSKTKNRLRKQSSQTCFSVDLLLQLLFPLQWYIVTRP